jgi:hypothetical protein
MVKQVKQLNERQILVENDGKFYVVSESIPNSVPLEVLVFSSDENGKITNWLEVGGEIGCGLDSYMKRLLESGSIVAPWRYEAEDDIPW